MGDNVIEVNTSDQPQHIKKSELQRTEELYAQDIETLVDAEVQLSLALEFAFEGTYAPFEQRFSEMFQSLHERSLAERNLNTISLDQYQKSGLPKPSFDLRERQLVHHELL